MIIFYESKILRKMNKPNGGSIGSILFFISHFNKKFKECFP